MPVLTWSRTVRKRERKKKGKGRRGGRKGKKEKTVFSLLLMYVLSSSPGKPDQRWEKKRRGSGEAQEEK